MMTKVAEVYEELKNNNMALESVEEMLAEVNNLSAEKLYYLLRVISDRNNTLIEQLMAC